MPLKNRGRGNRQAQNKRRRERLKNHPPRQKQKVMLYDGNMSYYPAAYCKIHKAYLTQGLVDTHKCHLRECAGLEWLVSDE